MANAVVQAEVGKEGKGPAGMTCLVYTIRAKLATNKKKAIIGQIFTKNHFFFFQTSEFPLFCFLTM